MHLRGRNFPKSVFCCHQASLVLESLRFLETCTYINDSLSRNFHSVTGRIFFQFLCFSKYINHLLMGFLLFLMIWFAYMELNIWMYIIVFLSSTIFGLAFRRYNVLKIMYFYIIADFLFENLIRLGYIQNIL